MLKKVIKTDNEMILSLNDAIDKYVGNRTLNCLVGCTTQNIWEDYLEFCKDEKIWNIGTSNQFKARLCKHHGVTTITRNVDGKVQRVLIYK